MIVIVIIMYVMITTTVMMIMMVTMTMVAEVDCSSSRLIRVVRDRRNLEPQSAAW